MRLSFLWLPKRLVAVVGLGLIVVAAGQSFAWAADPEKGPSAPEPRAVAGTFLGEDAGILRREAFGKPWLVVKHGEEINDGDLLLGFRDPVLESPNKTVQVRLWGNIDGEFPVPIIESAAKLHVPKDCDLDMSLDRGRADLTSLKKEGVARIIFRIWDVPFEVLLLEPGTRLAIGMYGRWPSGSRFKKNPGPDDVPALDLFALVISGKARLKRLGGTKKFYLTAPPGPALVQGSNQDSDSEPSPIYVKELPSWAHPETPATERGKKMAGYVDQLRKLVREKSLSEAIETFLASEDPDRRALAVAAMGATDDQKHLRQVLRDPKHPDVGEQGIRILRHWLGRCPGQDLKLYEGLVKEGKRSPSQAAIILQLLHSFSEEDLALPETYETLINFLDSEDYGIRGLAYWHLSRLVPQGRKIGYDPRAPKEERQRALKEWLKLVPPGQLPPRSNSKSKDSAE